jgi:uncharacterized protein CbrC (UPF0167 family)
LDDFEGILRRSCTLGLCARTPGFQGVQSELGIPSCWDIGTGTSELEEDERKKSEKADALHRSSSPSITVINK